ncbi:MAG: hypothetical protein A2Y97_13070 [Nitrospirae bacterium RBG_13_39_12]|nr:MAG: hypothetical protein A2Y97_13070 [Nitrospirae bacterium RBG_13_39_12]
MFGRLSDSPRRESFLPLFLLCNLIRRILDKSQNDNKTTFPYKCKIIWFIRKKVERVIRLTGFPLKNRGNDEQNQSFMNVILGLDPGIQCVFHLNMKETFIFIIINMVCSLLIRSWK